MCSARIGLSRVITATICVLHGCRSEGLSKEEVGQVVQGYPPLLCYSVEEQLRPTLDFLREIGVTDVKR